jgi:hypothetical protein
MVNHPQDRTDTRDTQGGLLHPLPQTFPHTPFQLVFFRWQRINTLLLKQRGKEFENAALSAG